MKLQLQHKYRAVDQVSDCWRRQLSGSFTATFLDDLLEYTYDGLAVETVMQAADQFRRLGRAIKALTRRTV